MMVCVYLMFIKKKVKRKERKEEKKEKKSRHQAPNLHTKCLLFSVVQKRPLRLTAALQAAAIQRSCREG